MKSIVGKFAVVVIAVVCGGSAMAQIPFLDGWDRAQRERERQEMHNLQMLRGVMELRQQQQEQQRQQEQQQQQIQQRQQMQEQQRRQSLEEIQEKARRQFAETEKNSCINEFVNDTAKRELLIKLGILVGQLCNCIEQEMFAMLTPELSGKVLVAMNEAAGDRQRFAASPAMTEYSSRYATARTGCIAQMVKGR